MARNTGTTAAASDDTSKGSCALVHDGGNSEAAGGHARNAMTHESGTPPTFRASLCEIFLSTDSHPFPCDQIESRPVRFRSCGFTTPPGLRSLLPQGSGGSSPLFRTRLRSPPACRLLRGASSRQASDRRRLSRRSCGRKASNRTTAKADHRWTHVRAVLVAHLDWRPIAAGGVPDKALCAGSVRGAGNPERPPCGRPVGLPDDVRRSVHAYCGRPTRRTIAWKRGSLRMGSHVGMPM